MPSHLDRSSLNAAGLSHADWSLLLFGVDWPNRLGKSLLGSTTLDQSGPGNEGLLHIHQISNVGASSSDCLMLYPGNSLEDALPLGRDAVVVFYKELLYIYFGETKYIS